MKINVSEKNNATIFQQCHKQEFFTTDKASHDIPLQWYSKTYVTIFASTPDGTCINEGFASAKTSIFQPPF